MKSNTPAWLGTIDPSVDTVLLGLENVLVQDWWQTALLSPNGLADIMNIDREVLFAAGAALWPAYLKSAKTVDAYWTHLAALIGRAIPEAVRLEVEALIQPNEYSSLIMNTLQARGLRIGLVSETPAFCLSSQAITADIQHSLTPELLFLSHAHSCSFYDEPGLLNIVESYCNAGSTLIVNDNITVVRKAGERGFQAVMYSMG